ncbi:Xylanase inhibitor, C-terminal [Sesbania bispinosa]|nr:Xylanase inhibitor, C-terminal [Sesbania bispinosa]
MHHPQIFLVSLALISFTVLSHQPDKISLVAPITKDTNTSLHSITVNYAERYVIDLDAPFFWRYCQFPLSLIPCSSPQCSAGQSYLSPMCPSSKNKPKNGKCNCVVTPMNPITKACALANLASGYLIISMTNGINPTETINFGSFPISCAPQTLLQSLPKDAVGVAGLSQAPLALPAQLNASHRKLAKKFAFCLPSSEETKGVIFFGDVPIYFLPPAKIDLIGTLSYTPLLQHPKSPEYYIGLKSISINGKGSYFRRNIFQLDNSGNGGVKISTTVPYTMLRSDIYKIFVKDFSEAIGGIPRAMKRGPFEVCVNARRIGLSVIPFPQIDLELSNGKNWTIFKPNSIIDMGNSVGCLAFVDGGKKAKQAVVIGTYQMENQLMLFDLAASRLGFSSSLLFYKTTCGGFNFTRGT